MEPAVTVVLVNWNGLKHLQNFLPALLGTSYPYMEVLMIDNASTDGSPEEVERRFPAVRVVRLKENTGFTGGNNAAFAYINTPYAVLLNTDVEVTPDWLTALVEEMERNPRMAASQPKILAYHHKERFEYAGASGGFLDRWGYPFCRGRIFETAETDTGQYDDFREVFWASGACMMVRTEIVKKIGLFDDRFFAHWEEIDFCWRAQNAGYSVGVVPASVVYHVGGGTLAKNNPRKVFLNFRNSLLTLLKNLPISQALPMIFIRMVLDGVAAYKGLAAGDVSYFGAILRAHLSFYGMVPYAWNQRRANLQIGIRPQPYFSLAGTLPSSVVYQYFIKKIDRFNRLEP